MGLDHEFFLLSKELHINNYSEWYSTNRYTWNEKVEIEDSIIRYILDTLRWVPTVLPEKNKRYHGIDCYGETIIEQTGVGILSKVLHGWLEIFSASPDKFKLKSELVWVEEKEDEGYWQYEFVEYDREVIIESLRKLLGFCEMVKEDNYYIFHYGI